MEIQQRQVRNTVLVGKLKLRREEKKEREKGQLFT